MVWEFRKSVRGFDVGVVGCLVYFRVLVGLEVMVIGGSFVDRFLWGGRGLIGVFRCFR